jgi:hypothetical protein
MIPPPTATQHPSSSRLAFESLLSKTPTDKSFPPIYRNFSSLFQPLVLYTEYCFLYFEFFIQGFTRELLHLQLDVAAQQLAQLPKTQACINHNV